MCGCDLHMTLVLKFSGMEHNGLRLFYPVNSETRSASIFFFLLFFLSKAVNCDISH